MTIDANLKEIFLTEAEELLSDFENSLVSLDKNPDDDQLINAIFRAAHTIKGNAGLVGYDRIVDFTHVMENVLDRLRNKVLKVNAPLISALLSCTDVLKALLSAVSEGGDLETVAGYDKNLDALRRYMGISPEIKEPSKPASPPPPSSPLPQASAQSEKIYEINMSFREDILETGQDPQMLIRELSDLGLVMEVAADASALPEFGQMDPFKMYLSFRVILKSREPMSSVQNVFIFVMDDNKIIIKDITGTYRDGVDISLADKKLGEMLVDDGYVSQEDIRKVISQQKKTGEMLVESGVITPDKIQKAVSKQEKAREVRRNTTIRVDTDKLDKLVNLVGELVIGVAQVEQITRDDSVEKGARISSVESLDQICRDLQEQVMAIRMVPIEATFTRFHRVVRDMAGDLGKKIELETYGAETELDKNVIEQLADPLMHLIRNCVDHGIETPDERAAAGKPEAGIIQLKASQQEGNIIIEIVDDGRGINRDKVLSKARERGLITDDAEISQQRIFSFLFEPGFSTADKITDVSGRGVGLDVVARNIEDLRGTVEIFSETGAGTTFRIKLPLTLAIIEGMTVQVGTETLTIPLLSIVEQIRPKSGEVKTIEGKGEVVDVRGEFLPLVRLHELFKFPTKKTNPYEALVVVLENEGRKYCVLVDDVLGQQQAVIKSLDKNFRKVDGTSGATILCDGQISLILDVHGLEKMAFDS